LHDLISLPGNNRDKIDALRSLLATSETALQGLDELAFILQHLEAIHTQADVTIDLTLARGLNYYTGAIFEVKALDTEIGSLCGGGRYDNLTGVFGLNGVPGVGISFGAERIFDALSLLSRFPNNAQQTTQLLFVHFGDKEARDLFPLLTQVRRAGIPAELYPEHAKLKKQLAYAHAKHIPFVALRGENERTNGAITLKTMATGEQSELSPDNLIPALANKLTN